MGGTVQDDMAMHVGDWHVVWQGGGSSLGLGQAALPAIRGPGRALQSLTPTLPHDSRTVAALGLVPGESSHSGHLHECRDGAR